MRSIKSFVYDIVSAVKLDSFFDGIKLVDVYPFQFKPTGLDYPVAAVSVGNIELTSTQIGESGRAGSVSLFIDIYVPFNYGKKSICDIFSRICSCLSEYCIEKISAQRVTADKTTSCYVMKNEFVFNEEILFGGEEDE